MKDLAEDTFLGKWSDWIRWVIFLPSAIIAPVLYFLFQSLMTSWFLDIGPDAFYLVIIRGISYGAGFVIVGSIVAPYYQKVVALILMIFVAMIVGIGIYSAVLIKAPIIDFIESLIMLVSAGFATYYVFQEISNEK